MGSVLATVAMFYFRGIALRLSLVLVAALWVTNTIAYDSLWQMVCTALAAAAAYGTWRLARQS